MFRHPDLLSTTNAVPSSATVNVDTWVTRGNAAFLMRTYESESELSRSLLTGTPLHSSFGYIIFQ